MEEAIANRMTVAEVFRKRDKQASIRKKRLWDLYRMTPSEYSALLAKQNGVCAICGGHDKNRVLAVDHDHKTGKVRGLLCAACNSALERLDNDISWDIKAHNYLQFPIADDLPLKEEVACEAA